MVPIVVTERGLIPALTVAGVAGDRTPIDPNGCFRFFMTFSHMHQAQQNVVALCVRDYGAIRPRSPSREAQKELCIYMRKAHKELTLEGREFSGAGRDLAPGEGHDSGFLVNLLTRGCVLLGVREEATPAGIAMKGSEVRIAVHLRLQIRGQPCVNRLSEQRECGIHSSPRALMWARV